MFKTNEDSELIHPLNIKTPDELHDKLFKRTEKVSWDKLNVHPPALLPFIKELFLSLPSHNLFQLNNIKEISVMIFNIDGGEFNGKSLKIFISDETLEKNIQQAGLEYLQQDIEIEKRVKTVDEVMDLIFNPKKTESEYKVIDSILNYLAKYIRSNDIGKFGIFLQSIDHELRHALFENLAPEPRDNSISGTFLFSLNMSDLLVKFPVLDSAEDVSKVTWTAFFQRFEFLLERDPDGDEVDYKVYKKAISEFVFNTWEEYINFIIDQKFFQEEAFTFLQFIDVYKKQGYFTGLTQELNELMDSFQNEEDVDRISKQLLSVYTKELPNKVFLEMVRYLEDKQLEKVFPKVHKMLSAFLQD